MAKYIVLYLLLNYSRQIYDMKSVKQQREIKYPENIKINERLESGDRLLIAVKAGLKPGTIRDMLLGYRRITDKVAKEIVELMNERDQLQNLLKVIADQ